MDDGLVLCEALHAIKHCSGLGPKPRVTVLAMEQVDGVNTSRLEVVSDWF